MFVIQDYGVEEDKTNDGRCWDIKVWCDEEEDDRGENEFDGWYHFRKIITVLL